jgi:hypothetical protein
MSDPPTWDPALLSAIGELERSRRAGWARVADLETIIDGYSWATAWLAKVLQDSGAADDDTVYGELRRVIGFLDQLDPPGRERWPRRDP